jgi:hypothetical protein
MPARACFDLNHRITLVQAAHRPKFARCEFRETVRIIATACSRVGSEK